jgi:hypothetical protein
MTRIAIPALVVMIAVGSMIGAASYNRSSQRLVITLTERELNLANWSVAEGDQPALQLWIAYQARYEPLDARNWLPESRLREIGFPMDVPPGSPQAAAAYDHVPPRLAWVVFEYDGAQWQAIERRRALRDPAAMPPEQNSSRLVPVDAGADFDALRTRYPSGHLILRGVIGLSYIANDPGGPLLHGTLREVVPGRVAVPQQFRSLLAELLHATRGDGTQPRYAAELAVGALGLPYLTGVRLLN